MLSFLRTLLSKQAKSWPVWHTVELGTQRNAGTMKAAIENAGMYVSLRAEDIFKEVTFTQKKHRLNLVVVTVAELGFPDIATTAQIFEAAQKQRLALCPAEVGPQLRLQYKNQPRCEWNFIAMKPVVGPDGALELFDVAHNDDGWLELSADLGHDDSKWQSYHRFVFVTGK